MILRSVLLLWVLALPVAARAGEVRAAVAANFSEPAAEIARRFEAVTGHRVTLSFGSTGQFYAQIVQGAPFDVLLSADAATPAKAIEQGHAVAGSAFTYAIGRLVLYSRTAGVTASEATLRAGTFQRLAIANPATAPYGAAAMETLRALGLADSLAPKIVQGSSIAQAFQFTDTGNAELGFVALSQVIRTSPGSRWLVPDALHAPLRQDAVLLKAGAGSAAREFLEFLKAPETKAAIESWGYAVGQ